MLEFLVNACSWTLQNSIEALIVIGLVAAIHFSLRRRLSPRFLSILWIIAGIRLVLPLAPESSVSVFNFFAKDASRSQVSSPVSAKKISPAPEPTETATENDLIPALSNTAFRFDQFLAVAWILGVVAIIGMAIFRQLGTFRQINRLPAVKDSRLIELMRNSARKAGVGATRLRLVESSRMKGIAVFGCLRPSHLIVPSDFSMCYTEDEIRGIFLHELAHVRRGDLLWNWATLFVQALHWFNPLVWWAGRKFLAERELECDRFVLKQLPRARHRDYGHALLKTLERGVGAPAPNPALVPFFSRKSELKHRLHMITKSHTISPFIHGFVAVLAIAACAMTFTSALTQDREGGGGRSPEAEARRDGPRDEEGERNVSREPDQPGTLHLTVLKDGVIISDRKVAFADLKGELEKGKFLSAVISALPDVPFQEVTKAMKLLGDNGIKHISFAAVDGKKQVVGREGERDGDRRVGPRDGEGERRMGPRDGDRERPREGDGDRRGDGERRVGPRDGEGERRMGPRDGDRERPREGDGDRRGDGERRVGPRDGDRAAIDSRLLNQLTRIYRTYDKNNDNAVTFEEWVAMKNYELSKDQRAREQGWFNQADANNDKKMTIGEWIDWKTSQGKQRDR